MAVNNVQGTNAFSSATATHSSYVVGSESDRVLTAVGVTTDLATRTHTATWDGNAMTLVRSREDLNGGVYSRVSTFEYLNPAASTGDVVLTASASSTEIAVFACYLDGAANQTAESENDAEDLVEPCQVTLTGLTSGAFLVGGVIGEAAGGDITAWTGEAATSTTLGLDIEVNATFNIHAALYYKTGSGSSETLGVEHSGTSLSYATLAASGWAPVGAGPAAGSVVVTALNDIQ